MRPLRIKKGFTGTVEEQRDAFVVVIEHEGEGLDQRTAATMKRALEDTAHRVARLRLSGEVDIKVKPLTNEYE